jgi:hypothetical protein
MVGLDPQPYAIAELIGFVEKTDFSRLVQRQNGVTRGRILHEAGRIAKASIRVRSYSTNDFRSIDLQ